MTCPSCRTTVPDGSRFCPSCGASLDVASAETRLSDDHTRLATPSSPTGGGRTSTTSGWLSSSGSIDHGRFAPGAVLDNRYRIIGLLGRGGMGEVYRADDLRLGQPVALKFLPKDLATDARRLAQFHNEVRTARQVSHPNVCRVYDIGEVEGDLYLSMEYVDGEDLAASLRRIGRFPEDKALELARQLAAGLAAAHERGVIHRDLKPANVMLDAAGKVRIMDFGLAAIGEVGDVRVGTPAYMAPEQLEGREVTTKSDIYALGLVLYEIFTGRRAYTAATLADLVQQQQSGTITAPAELVRNFDPAVERAIMRCIDRDPAKRPASALAVSAALPGGDPLAAALAAGETPSPEMVAAAGGEEIVLSRTTGAMWVALTAAFLAVALIVSPASMFSRIPLDKPPDVLADRAEQIRESFGYTDRAADRVTGFAYLTPYLTWARRQGAGKDRWSVLADARPAPFYFWRRTSPRALIPADAGGFPDRDDPPFNVTAMTLVDIDTTGRLLRFTAVPPEVEPQDDGHGSAAVNWDTAFSAAGLDPAAFHEVTPQRTPDMYADERRAWEGTFPGTTTKVRIEAASYRGKPVSFALVGPWSVPARDVAFDVPDNYTPPAQVFIVLALLIVAAWLAHRNVKSGRADRRGGFRLGVFTFFMMVTIWALSPHVADVSVEWRRFLVGVAIGLLLAGVLYIVYLALEPFVRRSFPTMLVGWTRLVSGRIRDPIVGRDLLAGVMFGAAIGAFDLLLTLLPVWFGRPEPIPHQPQASTLVGLRSLFLALTASLNNGLQNGLIFALQFALVRDGLMRLTRRLGSKKSADVSTPIAIVAVTMVNMIGSGSTWWVITTLSTIETAVTLLVMLRIGLLATVVMFVVSIVIGRLPLTIDSTRFYASDGWFALGLVLGLGILGYWMARQRASEPGRIQGVVPSA